MDFRKLMLVDSSGKPSSTLTAFALGFVVVNLKLLLSGMTVGGFSMSVFSGTEYAAAVGALGAIYVLRRNTGNKPEGE
jgi:hypothetical protein